MRIPFGKHRCNDGFEKVLNGPTKSYKKPMQNYGPRIPTEFGFLRSQAARLVGVLNAIS